MKKSFVLYHDQYEAVEDLTVEQKGQLLDAMFIYSRGEEMPEFDPIVKMAFKFFKIVFDRDNSKWEVRAKRNKDNGKKGGRPKKNNSNDLPDNPHEPKKPSGLSGLQKNPHEPKKPVSGSVSVSVNVSESGNETDIPTTPPLVPSDPYEKFPVDVVEFVKEFQAYIERETGFKASQSILKNCCDTVDKLIRLDKHTLTTIRDAMRWATMDDFWAGQVKSLAGLRKSGKNGMKKFDNLLTAMNRPQGGISLQSTTLEHNRSVMQEWLNE